MSNLMIGTTVRVRVKFIDYNINTGLDEIVDPLSVAALVYKWDGSVYNLVTSASTVRVAFGIYTYDWLVEESGKFKVRFIGDLGGGNGITVDNIFYTGTEVPTSSLLIDQDFYFLGTVSPLLVDPDYFLLFYPEASLSDITEWVYLFSVETLEMFDLPLTTTADSDDVTTLMIEFIKASVLCALSRTYGYGSGIPGGFGAAEDSFLLGDLQVKRGGNSDGPYGGTGKIQSAFAGDWCELAFALRQQLTRGATGMKWVLKAANYKNPIPCRKLRRFE